MAKPSIVLVLVVYCLLVCWCSGPILAAPGRPYGGGVVVGGGVRPIVARPSIYRAPVIYRPPVVVQKVIQPVIVPRPAPLLVG
ncbi:hypothetical protein ZHAS_00011351 [Anopheles sinensis]|uniref:Uncharacterized protein n=1 Tax=Anopheles sinensis TaxID=74873 RepID=A0A084VZW4_ANOSI|nr:hypothetical protein ZHAS_00011351 [Anopheles sinensis]